jgi:hypothetical protein
MVEISRALQADRPVIAKTGIDQKFNFHLEYAHRTEPTLRMIPPRRRSLQRSAASD